MTEGKQTLGVQHTWLVGNLMKLKEKWQQCYTTTQVTVTSFVKIIKMMCEMAASWGQCKPHLSDWNPNSMLVVQDTLSTVNASRKKWGTRNEINKCAIYSATEKDLDSSVVCSYNN